MKTKTRGKNLSSEFKQKVIDLYNSGLSQGEVAKKLDLWQPHVGYILRKNNIQSRRGPRIHFFDEHFLDKIDCEWKAYFVGLFFADGFNINNLRAHISLTENDKCILECLSKLIYGKNVLSFNKARERLYKKENRMIKSKPSYTLLINSKILATRLAILGGTQRKSLTLEFPTEIPEDYLNHFMRGYFDGDGCASGKQISLVSSENFCKSVQDYFNKLGIKSAVRKYDYRKVAYLCLKRESNELFTNYLYKNASIFLERKYQACLKTFNKENRDAVFA